MTRLDGYRNRNEMSESSNNKSFVLKLEEPLFHKLDELIRFKNYKENADLTKQKWITDAIRAKLAHDKKINLPQMKKKRCINYKVDKQLSQDLKNHLSELKKIDSSYTLKRWIAEAISKQLEPEHQK